MNNLDTIIKFAKELKALPYDIGEDARLLVHEDKETYELLLSMEPCEENFSNISGGADYAKSAIVGSEYDFMVIATSPYISMCAEDGKDLPAVLDDMGMIVGLKAPLVGNSAPSIGKALKKSSACILNSGYAVCCGRDIFEAFTCHTILAKDAEIYQKAKVLGGAKPIKLISGILENKVYKLKYSKLERSEK